MNDLRQINNEKKNKSVNSTTSKADVTTTQLSKKFNLNYDQPKLLNSRNVNSKCLYCDISFEDKASHGYH